MRCVSCSTPLSSREIFRSVELEDGSVIQVIEDMCETCVNKYIDRVDELDCSNYAHMEVTHPSKRTIFDDFEENT